MANTQHNAIVLFGEDCSAEITCHGAGTDGGGEVMAMGAHNHPTCNRTIGQTQQTDKVASVKETDVWNKTLEMVDYGWPCDDHFT